MHSFPPCAPPRLRPGGFTLVEIMIVVVIISMLALLAMPAFRKVLRTSQSNRFISDLRTFAHAFEAYSMQNGGWPPNAGNGAVPAGMSGELRHQVWNATNSVGGRWNWDFSSATGVAGIATTNVTAPDSQMIEIDARIDDGDLSAGLFQKTGTRFIYYLQQ